MATQCVIAEYETMVEAKLAIEALKAEHFTLRSLSVISSKDDPAATELLHLHHTEEDSAPVERTVNAAMLLGGSLAVPITAGTLLGPFAVAGPLVGMALGAAVGGLFATLHRWGVGEQVSADYEQRVIDGSVLVIVSEEDRPRIELAERVLRTTEPKTLERFDYV
ncbi:MAG: DUF1269 domain-containing protein [Planctomycetaceae bacterium]